jgi:uncharacterized protein (TIGR02246 family)
MIRFMTLIFLVSVILESGCGSTENDRRVRAVLDRQVTAWNQGDLEGFMAGYWKSDELLFTTPTGTTKGWQATLEGYKTRYPSREKMGALRFEGLKITTSGTDAAHVSGRYRLSTSDGPKTGRFELSFRRIDGAWLIVEDDTVPDAAAAAPPAQVLSPHAGQRGADAEGSGASQ